MNIRICVAEIIEYQLNDETGVDVFIEKELYDRYCKNKDEKNLIQIELSKAFHEIKPS